jgi:hypothetical protein
MEDQMDSYLKFEDRAMLYESLLKDLGLKKIDEQYQPVMNGSYYIIFSAGRFLIKYHNSKYGNQSELGIFVASNFEVNQWYPVTIIKNLINNESTLNTGNDFKLTNIVGLNDYIKKNYDKIAELFNAQNYRTTIKTINDLVYIESKKRFSS